jgi:hypothetical protein
MLYEAIRTREGEKIRAWARPSVYNPGIEVGLMKEVPAHVVPIEGKPGEVQNVQTTYYDAKLEWVKVELGTVQLNNPQGMANLPYELAQQLMDVLWDAGVRPAAAKASVGQLQATENHLKDLQTINGKLLDKVLENPAWIAIEKMTDFRTSKDPLSP